MPDNQTGPRLMDTMDLAKEARELRERHGLTQRELADQLVAAGHAESLTVQAISQAESDRVGARLNSLRVAIIQHLAGRKIAGPVWYYEDESV